MSQLTVVSNSSPLIGLNQINQLSVLEKLFGSITIPTAVAQEVAPSVKLPEWINLKPLSQPMAARILATALGPGESEAISLAVELGNAQIILDDRAARRLAQGLGLSVVGTLGIVLAAKRRGFLITLHPQLDALTNNGFHLAPELYQRVLVDAGE